MSNNTTLVSTFYVIGHKKNDWWPGFFVAVSDNHVDFYYTNRYIDQEKQKYGTS